MSYKLEDCYCSLETDKAILIESDNLIDEEWIPQSQIHEDSEVWKKGDGGALIVNDWYAKKKGWI